MKWRRSEPKNPSRKRRKAYKAATDLQAPPGHGFEKISDVVERLRKEAERKREEDER